MRFRITLLAVTLLLGLLTALMVPLAVAHAEERTRALFSQRQSDASRFALEAQDALESDSFEELAVDVAQYREVFGGEVLVVDANMVVVASAPPQGRPDRAQSEALTRALTGAPPEQPQRLWPWGEDRLLVAVPAGRDARVLGAVVVTAPSDGVRRSVAVRMALLAAAALGVVLIAAGALVPRLVGWVLRPVEELDDAALRLAEGELGTRVPAETGPPELRHLASSFNRLADAVEVSQEQQRNLVADASHQLGNPLTALRLRVEALRESAPDPRQVDLALEETERLDSLVEGLLEISEVGAEHVDVRAEELVAQVRHRCLIWEPALSDLRLDVPEAAYALVTRGLVDEVLDALLDNAAKFTDGAPVEVAVRVAGEHTSLVVRDHGPGIPAADRASVGERFFRGTRHQNIAGTGLGLAIVRARVARAGGSLAIASPDGGGLAVTARLRSADPGSSAAPPGAGRAGW